MPDGTENVTPDNTEGTTQTLDLQKIVTDLNAANAALALKEKEYKGLQTTYNALHDSNKALLAEKGSWAEERITLQNQIDQAQGGESDWQAKIDTLTAEKTALADKTQKLEQKTQRTDLILGEFPELLGFEQKGLLPEFDGDEEGFKTKLTTFKEALGEQFQKAIDDELDGAGPDNTDNENLAPNRDVVMEEMLRIAGDSTKQDRYRDLQKQLDDIDTKAAK